MNARLTAPDLPGLTYLQHLGSGGYAEVHLYEQHMPKLKVAVKVLNADSLDEAVQRQFTAEANTMAQLSDHPFIVPVMRADVTADGRPYIVMKYYPQPNLSVRARREHFAVPDVLKIGIQISSAVETAHRAGILHRDIKPANILTGPYGDPGLTDFGIAATTAESTSTAEGMSVPWAPPEVLFGQSDGDVRSDVYALGATLWHLLAGRSPFEVPGGDNSHLALMRRVQSEPVPTVRRDDVPERLSRLLRQALAKSPDGRPQSALALARGLQAVEQELRLPRTPIVVPEDPAPTATPLGEEEDSATVVRAARVVHAQDEPPARPVPAPATPTVVDDAPTTGRAGVVAPPPGAVPAQPGPRTSSSSPAPAGPRQRRAAPAAPEPEPTAKRARPVAPAAPDPTGTPSADVDAPSRRTGRTAAAVAVAVLLGGVGVAVAVGGSAPAEDAPTGPDVSEAQEAVTTSSGVAPGTPEVTVEAVGDTARFTVAYTGAEPGDSFRWTRTDGGQPASGRADEPLVELPRPACISVRAVRSTGLASASSSAVCAP